MEKDKAGEGGGGRGKRKKVYPAVEVEVNSGHHPSNHLAR